MVGDPVRAEVGEAITGLGRRGIETWMVTRDSRAVAQAVAAQVGITNVMAEVLPDGRLDRIVELQADSLSSGIHVAFAR